MPTDLLTVWKGREVWRSLDTDSYAMALRRIHRIAADLEADFEKARDLLGCAVDPVLLPFGNDTAAIQMPPVSAALPPQASSSRSSTRTIGDVYDRFTADPHHGWSKRTQIAHATTRKWVIEAFGAETPFADITREECRDFVDLLRDMPRNAHQRFPDMTIREVVAVAKSRGVTRVISTANLNAYVNRFGGVMNWAMNEGYIDRNPLKGLKLSDPVRKRDKRKPFSSEQLRLIFNAPIYTGCRDDTNGYAIPGEQRPRRARFWVPLIALFSGLRLNEICQLEVADIQNIDGIPCFRIASGVSATGDEKRVKTSASERIVPVHDELVRFGFLAFVESQRLCGETSLFPELPLGHLGYRSTTLSKWFSRFLESAGATAPLTCFHSFRHNFRDGLREAKIDRDVALILGGWTSNGKRASIADNYGSGPQPVMLAEAINRLSYPGLNIQHLIVVGLDRDD